MHNNALSANIKCKVKQNSEHRIKMTVVYQFQWILLEWFGYRVLYILNVIVI